MPETWPQTESRIHLEYKDILTFIFLFPENEHEDVSTIFSN